VSSGYKKIEVAGLLIINGIIDTMELDAENHTCKLCLKKTRIPATNVCDACHAKIANCKGKPNTAHLRFSKHGMYCLKCKHVVKVDNAHLSSGVFQTYCNPCRSKLTKASKIRVSSNKRIRKKGRREKTKAKLVPVENAKSDDETFEIVEDADDVEEVDCPPDVTPTEIEEFTVDTPRSPASAITSPITPRDELPSYPKAVLVAGTCQHCQCVSYFAIPTVLPAP